MVAARTRPASSGCRHATRDSGGEGARDVERGPAGTVRRGSPVGGHHLEGADVVGLAGSSPSQSGSRSRLPIARSRREDACAGETSRRSSAATIAMSCDPTSHSVTASGPGPPRRGRSRVGVPLHVAPGGAGEGTLGRVEGGLGRPERQRPGRIGHADREEVASGARARPVIRRADGEEGRPQPRRGTRSGARAARRPRRKVTAPLP